MSNVTLSIGGRNYTVACASGEEEHVTSLGRAIDAKIQSMGAAGTTESRQLLFAALLLADEVHEVKSASRAAPVAPAIDDDQAERLEAIAAKLEACALALEG
ncbi:cell division protein ZapA [Novosphingobium sp. APW14]|jgi:cell division protein ZapA|uniref:cell division protein ZapA n=1 Tax=Novosphingobium sp. APW14 TaxID=3077237 RepID=UPI0028DE7F6B|nr:cell division protein ZapA [Novosphingobium sp. APW14]MDT9014023.1 cell division protein ZapA [Novosphingobium sp. APW14]